ncbi:putative trafficking protein particle complex subunit 13 like protein [Ditylenchus destructor]|nr:putative trafficking protein particle complex subunit 13 like protein [Ditylenchus destructor]
MSSGIVTEHQLVLRVMRLARPQFNTPVSFPVDHADPYAPGIANAVKEITGEESVDFPLGSYLMAPQTMALIYLGETFTFYVAILNDGATDCTDVCVQVDIQTQSQRGLV